MFNWIMKKNVMLVDNVVVYFCKVLMYGYMLVDGQGIEMVVLVKEFVQSKQEQICDKYLVVKVEEVGVYFCELEIDDQIKLIECYNEMVVGLKDLMLLLKKKVSKLVQMSFF